MSREAQCHCGALALECAGEPVKVSLCHCLDCQRRSGSLFSVAAFFPREQITIVRGEARRFTRPSASGFAVTFSFCPGCGTNLWWEPERLPAMIGVAAGTFADPSFPAPTQAVWSENAHAWLDLPAIIAGHARNPERKSG